ncbi:serine hydrolase [Pseudomonas sp. C32]|jgi:CubicO group peptidase (beta-lactamase class C family)|uniref:serine hydrolase domain-containing protein n=1 Tax=Pseudomonas sp. C32 TaxID=1529208 RepID=UPI002627969F|nr:serine hydrolase [Pseudomonas sp. C32]MDN4546786.1 serine hydrolase [Pseudomonas sp. C32]
MTTQLYVMADPRALKALYKRSDDEMTTEQKKVMKGFPPPLEYVATRANHHRQPFSSWSFRNMSRLLPSEPIFCSGGEPELLTAKYTELEKLEFKSACGEKFSINQHLLATRTNGLIVIRNGIVLYERYFSGMTTNDRHAWFSACQTLIGILAEELIFRDVLNPEMPVGLIIPALKGSAYEHATVRHLLDMSVGVRYDEDYSDVNSDSAKYMYITGIRETPANYTVPKSLCEYLRSLKPEREHGGFFQYVSANCEALSWVLEVITGERFAQLISNLWKKLRCEGDAYYVTDGWGRSAAAGGFCSTLNDMGRLGQLLVNNGRVGNRQIIPEKVFSNIFAGGDPSIFSRQTDYNTWSPGASYKSLNYVFDTDTVMASGIHGQYLFVDQKTNTVIAKLSSSEDPVSLLDVDTVRLLRFISRTWAG